MIKKDLEAAGIDPEDHGIGKLDFHSLRHTFGSLLAAAGVHPKVAQDLMRHSDINLTMSRYTHTLVGQQAKAINALPDLSQPSRQAQKRTGTDNTDFADYRARQKTTEIGQKYPAKILAKSCEKRGTTANNYGQKERSEVMCDDNKKPHHQAKSTVSKPKMGVNGEGGIRTRGTDKPYTAFPRLLLKPLGHLSKIMIMVGPIPSRPPVAIAPPVKYAKTLVYARIKTQ